MDVMRYCEGIAPDRVAYSFYPIDFGIVLLGLSNKGVAILNIQDTEQLLMKQLDRKYPGDKSNTPIASELASWVAALFRAPGSVDLNMPLDLRGTAFQKAVWQALRRIPAGTTQSYSQVAQSIGKPKTARAVANACGKNPIMLLVPCHRVIHQDGSISGFGGGVWRKKILLQRERESV